MGGWSSKFTGLSRVLEACGKVLRNFTFTLIFNFA
jgi:hypothetical protein